MTTDQIKSTLRIFTNGTGDISILRGPRRRKERQEVISAILGYRITSAEAGWNRLVYEVAMFACISWDRCEAVKLEGIKQWIRGER